MNRSTPGLLLLGIAMALFAARLCHGAVEVGSSRDEVISELGMPEFEYTRGGIEVLSYVGEEIELRDGVVIRVPADLSARIEQGQDRRRELAAADAARAAEAAKAARAAQQKRATTRTVQAGKRKPAGGASVRVVSDGGKKINLKSYLKPGKVTVLDFYADWCGPCRQISPTLESLANGDRNVELVKVDIVRWGTPVTEQFQIQSIPFVCVYNSRGQRVGKPSHSLPQIMENVAKAK